MESVRVEVRRRQRKELLTDIHLPTALSWAPDGKWLAFAATLHSRSGLWLFDASTGELVFATDHPVYAKELCRGSRQFVVPIVMRTGHRALRGRRPGHPRSSRARRRTSGERPNRPRSGAPT